jgi:fatty-acyl-CoA synthase
MSIPVDSAPSLAAPSDFVRLGYRLQPAESLLRSLDGRASSGNLTVHSSNGEVWTRSWPEVADLASQQAAVWLAQGKARQGGVIAVWGDTTPAVVVAILAVWLAGGTVTVLPGASAGFPLAAVHSTRASATPMLWCVDEDHASSVACFLDGDTRLELLNLQRPSGKGTRLAASPQRGDGLAVLQQTSGTTAGPRAVRVMDRNIESNVSMIRSRLDVNARSDRLLAWLPLIS